MAELHVEPKKQGAGMNWIWIVIALLIIGAIVYFMMRNNDTKTNNGNTTNSTSTSWLMQDTQRLQAA